MKIHPATVCQTLKIDVFLTFSSGFPAKRYFRIELISFVSTRVIDGDTYIKDLRGEEEETTIKDRFEDKKNEKMEGSM
uniref:Uncharacterized protein n=1 Tax=Romanomermis culicivorax TaxID=13658 RepID=A0A915IAW1_ROMCU